MASKCWFILKQTHYPPPVIPPTGIGRVHGSGPICLGHLIPDLKHLDNVINTGGPLDIPLNTPIYPTKAWNLTLDVKKASGASLSSSIGVPIAVAAGLTVKLDAGVAFRNTISNHWEFESLETFIFQPTREYVEDSVEEPEVVTYLERRRPFRSSTLFMITGIIVARGAKTTVSESARRDLYGGPGLEFPMLAETGLHAGRSREVGFSSFAHKTSDFVWAVRLAKITKGLLDKQWSHETYSSGATFGLSEESENFQQLVEALRREGFELAETVELQADSNVFVIGTDGAETASG